MPQYSATIIVNMAIFHDSTVGSRITIPSCHCNYWRLGNEPIELRRLQIWLTIGLVHLCHMGRGQSSDFVLEPMSSSVSSLDKFAATARRTQDVGRISDRVYRARGMLHCVQKREDHDHGRSWSTSSRLSVQNGV